jgi:hypothetical protein
VFLESDKFVVSRSPFCIARGFGLAGAAATAAAARGGGLLERVTLGAIPVTPQIRQNDALQVQQQQLCPTPAPQTNYWRTICTYDGD